MFYISSVMKGLLNATRIDPARLHGEVEERVHRHMRQMDETDTIPRMLGKAASLAVTNIRRKNRYVLLSLSGRGLHYGERNATECHLIVPGTLPHVVRPGILGRQLREVVGLGAVDSTLGSCEIAEVNDAAFDGATEFALKSRWLRFGD